MTNFLPSWRARQVLPTLLSFVMSARPLTSAPPRRLPIAPFADFDQFKPLFEQVKKDIASGIRQTRRFQTMAEIKKGEFFIVGGQVAYIAK